MPASTFHLACFVLLLLICSILLGHVAYAQPLTTCGCETIPTVEWSAEFTSFPTTISSLSDPTQCWQLNKTVGGVTCDGLCVYLGPCNGSSRSSSSSSSSSPSTPTWIYNSSSQRMTVASPPEQAGWCLDENTANLYIQAYPNCLAGDTHQLWSVTTVNNTTTTSILQIHERWTGSNLCIGQPGSSAVCPPPPPPPGEEFCFRYHPIHASNVYDPSGPFLSPDEKFWHVWEDNGGWSHYISTDLLRWTEMTPASTGFGGLTGSIGITPEAVVAFFPEPNQGGVDAAISTDSMNYTTWTSLGRVITAPEMAGTNFRDPLRPFLYQGKYYVGVGCNNQSQSADLCIFQSTNGANITNFTYMGTMFSTNVTYGTMNSDIVWVNSSVHATMLECPDMFQLTEDTWMLVGSLYSTNQWWVGKVVPSSSSSSSASSNSSSTSNLPSFIPMNVGILDYGNMYAGKTGTSFLGNIGDRRVLFGFTGWNEPSADPACGRALVIPRDISLSSDGTFPLFNPIPELQSLKRMERNSDGSAYKRVTSPAIASSSSSSFSFTSSSQALVNGAQVWVNILCTLPSPPPSSGRLYTRVLGSADGSESAYTEIGYDFAAYNGALYINHSSCCADPNSIVQFAPAPSATSFINSQNMLNLTVFVDGSIIESFLSGVVTSTALVNPDVATGGHAANRTTSFTNGVAAQGVSCTAESWQLVSLSHAERRTSKRTNKRTTTSSNNKATTTTSPTTSSTKSLLRFSGPTEPSSSLFISPVNYTHELLGPVSANPHPLPSYFYAAQWDNPLPITNTTPIQPGSEPNSCQPPSGDSTVDWFIDNGAMRICAINVPIASTAAASENNVGAANSVVYELVADGSGSSNEGARSGGKQESYQGPAPPVPCGQEFDAFLSPTDDAYTTSLPMNLLTQLDGAPSLGQMASFTVQFNAQLIVWNITEARCGPPNSCGPSGQLEYAYATLGLVLHNSNPTNESREQSQPGRGGSHTTPSSTTEETLFYQVILADTRAMSPNCKNNDPCTTPFTNWFFNTLPNLGVSDASSAINQPCLSHTPPSAAEVEKEDEDTMGRVSSSSPALLPTAYNISLLPRLSSLLAEGASKYGADGNLSHWYVSGFYVGVGLEGSAIAGIQVGGLDLQYT